jgi:thioredoxin reductase (NADPH)
MRRANTNQLENQPAYQVNSEQLLDCVILGAGPAGLTALTYLTRFHRRVLALGAVRHSSRVHLIDRSHNVPGYRDGISGDELIDHLREQAQKVGGKACEHFAERVQGCDNNFTIHLNTGATLRARKLILCMGVRDRRPDIPDAEKHEGDFLRYCPVCDGYEHTDKRLGLLGSGAAVARHALFLRTFSPHISVFLHGESPESLGDYAAVLARKNVAIHAARVVGFEANDQQSVHGACGIFLEDGSSHKLDVLYSALGCNVQLAPVQHIGLKVDDAGYIVTDGAQKTSIPGIYAAGDITSQLNQISIAFGQAAIAAINVHNELDEQDEQQDDDLKELQQEQA